jgi:DNA repair exonuclease SbcCD ATPase subunit
MRFEELRIRGFLSFGPDEQVVKLGKRGLVLVEGENLDDATVANNGSGKSSISEALLWALYGETLRGVSGDDVVNRKVKSGCRVEVSFTNDNGESFKVIRHRKDPVEKNRLEFIGGKAGLTANEASATEEHITQAVGMDFETFTSAVVFGQGQLKHFASMTDKEMKAVIDKLVGIQQLVDAHKAAKADLTATTQELRDLEAKRVDTTSLEGFLRDAERERDEWGGLQAKLIKKLEAAVVPQVSTAKVVKQMQEARDLFAVAVQDEEAKAKVLEKADREVATALAEATALERSIAKLTTQTTGMCQSCGADVDAKNVARHRKEMEKDLAAAHEVTTAVSAKRLKARTARNEARDLVKQASDVVDTLKTEMANITAANARASESETRLEEARSATNPHEKAVSKFKTKIAEVEAANALVAKKAKAKLGEVKLREFVVAMFSDKGGPGLPPLKGLLVESVAPFLNKKLAYYSRFLTDGAISVEFETTTTLKSGEQRESYGLKAKNRYGADAYEGSSGGERRKIDAAVFFAFQALAASRSAEQIRFGCFDEVFDALDETAQEAMMELLVEECSKKDMVLVITQRNDLAAYFSKRMKVVKKNGLSRIVASK